MTIVIYNADDVIIAVLSDRRSVNAFLNGYLTIAGYAYHTIEY